ncbi:hypothetical protein RHGRI_018158 [Rhododendron griersonianum]|uniref:Uncharacterized protein n=1 Tax=Rhododendron griersonianum TaxID=479676 RepID=A0AAV6K0F9_9ERIC|nr:hypothetical protein RHGRI_018158 [Rhododendron griersonianum]
MVIISTSVMSYPAMAQLLSNTFYYKRFFLYYAFNVLGGLDNEGKVCVFTYDAVGSYERVGYSAQGSGSTLIMPSLDNQLKSPSPLLLPAKDAVTPLSELEAIDLVKTCFASATERDIYTGDKLEIMVLNVDGIIDYYRTRGIALTLLQRKPELACMEPSASNVLVEKCSSFRSGTFLNFWQSLIYSAVIIILAGLATVPFVLRLDNKRHWLHLVLVVVVSAYPCALILSTPVATFCALSKAATSGLLIKGGEYLETLSKIKILAFNKTGTITRGEFVVTDFHSVSNEVTLNTPLYWVSGIESKSSHPMVAALIDYAQTLSIEVKPERVEEFEKNLGEGVHGKDVYVGNHKIALRARCATAPSIGHCGEGKSVGYIFLGAAPAGIFSLSDSCRTGVGEVINELKSMNIKTVMLTGDRHEAAIEAQKQLAGALGAVHDGLLPKDKTQIISNFQKEAPTTMVGDGVNDAPALFATHVYQQLLAKTSLKS